MSDIYAEKIGQVINNPQGNVEQHIHKYPAQSALPDSIPVTNGFVGRADYLNELREFYQKGSRAFVLHGIGGVGKSATALRFAGEIAGEYAAKIFVDMKGLQSPISTRDARLNIVRQFDRTIPPDISDAEIESIYVSKVQNQPTLFVLDNADGEAQIAPLLIVKDACFIVSSKNNFALTDGETKRLGAMSPEDAKELLFSIAGEEKFEGRADELAEMAGYLPMALKPLAKLLKRRFKTIAGILRDYADKKKRLEIIDHDHNNLSVEASFALSYDALPPEMQQYWRRLSVFPADFEKQAASTVFGTEFEDGWTILQQLYDYSLIEEDSTSTNEQPRFNLHDLAREFASNYLSEDERFQVQLRFALYYSSVLMNAQIMQEERRENYYVAALKLIDSEWINITTGQKWATEFAENDDNAAKLCTEYCGYARYFIVLRLHPRTDINWLEAGLMAARKLKARRSEGSILGNLASGYHNLGFYREAVDYYEQALPICREVGDKISESVNLGNIGSIYCIFGDYQKAIDYQQQSLKIKREIKDRFGESNGLNNLGFSYRVLRNYRQAIECFEQSLLMCREVRNRLGEGNALGNLGVIYSDFRAYQAAIDYHEQALLIACELGNRSSESKHLSNLGTAYCNLGEFNKAIEYQEQSLLISRAIGDRLSEGGTLGDMGLPYYNLGEKDMACRLWREAVTILEAIEASDARFFRQYIEEYCKD